ncbi:MAG: glycosyltransferase, partial [Anaerolineales bacterium]|nr:glycosyltransferase [Anaerolineales bacterium]
MISGLVSVMMPAYNAERFIAEAIESVLAQSYEQWELLVVNDGSKDRTAVITARYDDPRIRLINKENGGEATARNRAIKESRGEFIAYLDSDDAWLPHHLQVTVAYLQAHPEREAVYTDGYHYTPEGKRTKPLSARRRGPFEGDIFAQVVRASDVFGPPICVVLRHELVAQHQLRYDTRIVIGPDWDFFTRYSELATFGYLDDKTCLYRVHQTNITVQVDRKRRAGYLALCREKATQLARFDELPVWVRTAVYDDLLVYLTIGQPQRQNQLVQTAQFAALPADK